MTEEMFTVAILAGGLATRLHPLTETVPKSLVDVNGEPFIAHQLRLLKGRGIGRVVVCVGHLGEMIEDQIGDGQQFDLQVRYAFDGARLRGTAGALRHALPLLGNAFFVTYGDSYLDCDYRAIQDAFVRAGRAGLMVVYRNDNHWDKSNVEFVGGQIKSYDKNNRTDRMEHIDYGLGILAKSVFDGSLSDDPYDLEELYQHLLRTDNLRAFEVSERFYEVGSTEGLNGLRAYLSQCSGSDRRIEE